MRQALLYAVAGGFLIALLRWIEYWHVVRSWPVVWYGGVIAILCSLFGIWLGSRLRADRVGTESNSTLRHGAVSPAEIGMTPREHEILQLIAAGLSNREIGERLFVTENTVKTHSSRILQKLDARRRTEAVARARTIGLLRDA